jgi:hypothetical protein
MSRSVVHADAVSAAGQLEDAKPTDQGDVRSILPTKQYRFFNGSGNTAHRFPVVD